jgi:hypothetical protein
MRYVFILLVLMGFPALAQTVDVSSGAHDGFTRLVLQLPAPQDWQLGRTTDGYELRIAGPAPRYDLSRVFDPIDHRRLAAIWADPDSGALRIGLACACHVMPFEYRPGVIVMDLKDGAPPKGSSFENTLSGDLLPPLVAVAPIRPKPRPDRTPFQWTQLALNSGLSDTPPVQVLPTLSVPAQQDAPDLGPLRTALVAQLSRGVSQGVVDIAPSLARPKGGPVPQDPAMAHIRIGPMPGLAARPANESPDTVTADGKACLPDASLDIAAWGDDRPVAEQMAGAMTGLTEEFDRPVPDAVARAVRFNLFLGFGVEARALMTAFDTDLAEVSVWQAMSRIVDGQPDPDGPFRGMLACDGAAALWAALSQPELRPADADTGAVIRSFAALPPHLRRDLGPVLVDRFLAGDDKETARNLRDAILRATGGDGPDSQMLDASFALKAGDTVTAEAALLPLIDASGPATSDALLALVDVRLAALQPMEPAHVTALEALLHEADGGTDAPRYQRAVVLARGLSGDFAGAFAGLPTVPDSAPDLWRILAQTGPDSAVISNALLVDGSPVPDSGPDTRKRLAERLVDLGFPDQALVWLADVADPVLSARAQLRRQDPQAALIALGDMVGSDASPLRAKALSMIGDASTAADTYAAAGLVEDALQETIKARNWPRLADTGPAHWQGAAIEVTASDLAAAPGPLARGRALTERTETTRLAIDALLSSVGPPEKP